MRKSRSGKGSSTRRGVLHRSRSYWIRTNLRSTRVPTRIWFERRSRKGLLKYSYGRETAHQDQPQKNEHYPHQDLMAAAGCDLPRAHRDAVESKQANHGKETIDT